MCLILDLPDGQITDSKHRGLFNILAFVLLREIEMEEADGKHAHRY